MAQSRRPWWLRYVPKKGENKTDYSTKRKDYAVRLGEFLRSIRESKISSLRFKTTIADRLGISRQEYGNFESAGVDMPYSNLPLILEILQANPYNAVRKLLPVAGDEYIECRKHLLDIMIDRGMDLSSLSPAFPPGTVKRPPFAREDDTRFDYSYSANFRAKYTTTREEPGTYIHDDPTVVAADLITLSDQALDIEHANMFRQMLLYCVFYYWANVDRKTEEYRQFWEDMLNYLSDKNN